MDKNIKSPGCPMTVEMGAVCLTPENYSGNLKQQPPLAVDDEEVPF